MPSKEQTHNNDKVSSKQQSPKPTTRNLDLQTDSDTLIQRARIDPGSLTPSNILQLQRVIGNQAVSRLLIPTVKHQAIQKKETKTGLPDNQIAGQMKIHPTISPLKNRGFVEGQGVVQRGGDTGYGASLDDMRAYSNENKTVKPIKPETLADFKAVQELLHNMELVMKYLKIIDGYIEKNTNQKMSHREKFDQVARGIEKDLGYGEVQTLTLEAGVQDGAKAVRSFARAGQPFLDFGVSPRHGLSTHRLQQLIVGLAYQEGNIKLNNPDGPVGVYKELGNPSYGVYLERINKAPLLRREAAPGEQPRKKLYAWELVLDRFQGKSGVYLIDSAGEDVVPKLGSFDAGIPISINLAITGNLSKDVPNLSQALKEDEIEHNLVIDKDSQQRQRLQRNKMYMGIAALGAVLAIAGWWFLKKG